ncbi:hypothetical protein PQE75_gp138 [Bacillus phage vB_BcoS-136]|uniref:Uncharacterized protein n=1 Tax=Bacillus phage vB_BcoS-136 TaxID=2419619 RepID=A0A3G3BW93_9CAUD|nr:hypothetical protein PQE75_gp138 [Bacillus phage vB_BcoS-136]AYP68341.1 hypothetical protein vBBcoS136_00227 [Bacillus phage vB_BcoS-136]
MINRIIVKDLEVNEEFEVLQYSSTNTSITIRNLKYGICSQDRDKLEFVRVE